MTDRLQPLEIEPASIKPARSSLRRAIGISLMVLAALFFTTVVFRVVNPVGPIGIAEMLGTPTTKRPWLPLGKMSPTFRALAEGTRKSAQEFERRARVSRELGKLPSLALSMSGRRLHGWARIGIVLSIVWAIMGSIWALNLLFGPVYQNYATCQTLISASPSDCQQLFQTQLADARRRRLTAVAIVGLGPIPVAWMLVYGLVALVRWIRRGFQPST